MSSQTDPQDHILCNRIIVHRKYVRRDVDEELRGIHSSAIYHMSAIHHRFVVVSAKRIVSRQTYDRLQTYPAHVSRSLTSMLRSPSYLPLAYHGCADRTILRSDLISLSCSCTVGRSRRGLWRRRLGPCMIAFGVAGGGAIGRLLLESLYSVPPVRILWSVYLLCSAFLEISLSVLWGRFQPLDLALSLWS